MTLTPLPTSASAEAYRPQHDHFLNLLVTARAREAELRHTAYELTQCGQTEHSLRQQIGLLCSSLRTLVLTCTQITHIMAYASINLDCLAGPLRNRRRSTAKDCLRGDLPQLH